MQLIINYSKILFFILILCCFAASCEQDSTEIGKEFIDTHSSMAFIDSITVKVSTFQYDSIPTSGQNEILCGSISDGDFGTISAKSFFQVGTTSLPTPTNTLIYDSIALNLTFNKYVYGDTLNFFTIKVKKLETNLNLNDDGYLYNTSLFSSYNTKTAELLGSTTLKPRPNLKSTLLIRLKDGLGLDLFNKLREGHDSVKTNLEFLKYFNGIILTTDSADNNNLIIGFSTTAASLRLYYHEKNSQIEEGTNGPYVDFPIVNTNKQFNQIKSSKDVSNPLSSLPKNKGLLNSDSTNNCAYMQCGVGMAIKIEFPYIKNLQAMSKYYRILRADLQIKPLTTSYNSIFRLPTQMGLSRTDGDNDIGSFITDANNATNYGNLGTVDHIFHENNMYTYDVTSYIYSLMSSSNMDNLGLIFVSPNFQTSLERIVIGDQNNEKSQISLKVYYLKYDE